MSVARIILFGLMVTSAFSYGRTENSNITVYSYLRQSFSTDGVLKKPLFVISNVNPEEDELSGYVAEGGLSALASDPNGQATYDALRFQGGTALLIHPNFVSPTALESATETAAVSPLRLPNLATLAVLVASAVGIPWLLSGSSKKNSTNTTTFKHEGYLLKLCKLELSDDSVRVIEGLNQLPASVINNE